MQACAVNSASEISPKEVSNNAIESSATFVWTCLQIFVLYSDPRGTLYVRANLTDFQGNPIPNELIHFGFREYRYPERLTDAYEGLGTQLTNGSGIAECLTGLAVFPNTYIVKSWYEGNSSFSGSERRANIVVTERWKSVIHIENDGSIDPPNAPLLRAGNSYLLTDDIAAGSYGINIEKDNIVLNGGGHVVQSFPNCLGSCGVSLSGRNNVTVRDVTIKCFGIAVDLSNSWSSTVTRTVISGSAYPSLSLEMGINLSGASNSTFCENDIFNTFVGILYRSSFNNLIYHNNFFNITYAQANGGNSTNMWDNSYPSGGNYWSGYVSIDENSGPSQNETGRDGIWDSPYFMDANNQDNYPLVNPWTWPIDVGFEFAPSCLNLETKGRSATCIIRLPPGFVPNDMNFSSLLVNGTVPIVPSEPINVSSDCITIKFGCTAIVIKTIFRGIKFGDIALTVNGRFNNGTAFEGTARVRVTSAGDVDFDGKVDLYDAISASHFFGHVMSNPESDAAPGADQDGNGVVDILDLIIIAGHFGRIYQPA